MSGDEILWWLQDLWFDVTHLGDADIPSLLARLVLLVVVIVLGHQILRVFTRLLGDVFRPVINAVWSVMRGVFWFVTAPFWLPVHWWRKWRESRDDKRHRREYERSQQAQIDAKEAERLRHVQEQADEYRRMKELLSPLE